MGWRGISTTQYDPTLTLVVYPAIYDPDGTGSKAYYVLYDRVNKRINTQKAVSLFWSTPVWSPDGSKFVINDTDGDGEFYVITRTGLISKVSHLNGVEGGNSHNDKKFSDLYSWSPDGRYLAFWLETGYPDSIKGEFTGTFAILDTDTGDTTDYCLPGGERLGEFNGRHADIFWPLWSPDGKALVTIAYFQGDFFETVLINLAGGFAAQIAGNLVPVGWLGGVSK